MVDPNLEGRKISDKAKSVISDLSASESFNMEDAYNTVREKAEDYTDSAGEFIQEHPFSAVLGAAAVGVVVGLLLGRRD